MTARYLIGVYDRAGEYFTTEAATLPLAVQLQLALKARWPDKVVEIMDGERDGRVIDEDHDNG